MTQQFSNTAIIAGNLVADARVVNTKASLKDGSPFQIVEATLAINGSRKDAQPSFITVQLVGYTAKRVIDAGKHLKGSSLGVVGVLVDDKYTDESGKVHSRIKVRGEDVMFGDKFISNFNSVTLYAHVASEPTKGSKGEVEFSRMSVGNSIYNAQKKERESSFFQLVAFGSRGQFMADYFHKGDAVMVQGRLHTSKTEGQNPDGSTVSYYNTSIVVSDITFAQRKSVKDEASVPADTDLPDEPEQGVDYSTPNFGAGASQSTYAGMPGVDMDEIDLELPF